MEKKLLIKEKSFIETEITAVTNEGSGVSRYEGMVVFTPLTAPGDLAKIKVAKVGKSFMTMFFLILVMKLAEADASASTSFQSLQNVDNWYN